VAVHNLPEGLAARLREGYAPGPAFQRLIEGADFDHTPDVAEVDDPMARTVVDAGIRTLLRVALRKDGILLGQIVSARKEGRPFADKEIALLQSFAAQAVIAIENARLINETREALGQQTATAEILRVISQSPTDVQPVFDAIVESAVRLSDSLHCTLYSFDGAIMHLDAHYQVGPETLALLKERFPAPPDRDTVGGRALLDRVIINVADIVRDSRFPASQSLLGPGGYRAVLAVPMMREEQPIGLIFVVRREPVAFSSKQIELLRTFAAQAVIAINNVRLFGDGQAHARNLQVALEQQTATAEILSVINSSPGDLTPVFEMILEKAHALCSGAHGSLQLFDGERFRAVAVHGLPEEMADSLRQGYTP